MYLQNEDLNKIKQIGIELLSGIELEFFTRMWDTNYNTYENRINALKFNSLNKVLDAGCGFGQWSIPLCMLNKQVYSVDVNSKRINVLKRIKKELGLTHLKISNQSIQKLNFKNDFFDAIFCYSVIYFTEYEKTVSEFYRILKPGGKLYINTNGIGWYLYNLLEGHNETKNFDSKKMAMKALNNSINYFSNQNFTFGDQIIIPSSSLIDTLSKIGFINIIKESDGNIILDNKYLPKNFYVSKYHNFESVYEIVATKN